MLRGVPILYGVFTQPDPMSAPHVEVWCGWCESVHRHGASAGYRAAHCTCSESPYRGSGYEIRIRSTEPTRVGTIPAAPYAGRRRLQNAVGEAAGGMRVILLREVFGLSRGRRAHQRIGRARISVSGNAWSIDPDAFSSISDRGAAPVLPSLYAGRDLLGLASASYGIARGRVGVLLLQAVAGAPFNALAGEAIAAAIEAGCAYQGEAVALGVPGGLYGGERSLRGALEGAAGGLGACLTRSALRARARLPSSGRAGRVGDDASGGERAIESSPYASTAGRDARSGLPGRCLIALLSALYGVPYGLVGVRILEAVSWTSFNADARRSIALAIGAACTECGTDRTAIEGGLLLTPPVLAGTLACP